MAYDAVAIVQDEFQHGTGHKVRSYRVLEALRRDNITCSTVYSSTLSRWNDAAFLEFINCFTVVILDCVELPEAHSALAHHPCVICISPIFNHSDWINHWITYFQPNNFFKNRDVYVDTSFRVFDDGAFVNQSDRIKSKKLLVCISGNPEILFRYEHAIFEIVSSGIWPQVRIIQKDKLIPKAFLQIDIELEVADFISDSLWADGSTYNSVLTGDGLMVREALSRGYPVISITDSYGKGKLTDLFNYEHFFLYNTEGQKTGMSWKDLRKFTNSPLAPYFMQSGEVSIAKQIVKIMEQSCL